MSRLTALLAIAILLACHMTAHQNHSPEAPRTDPERHIANADITWDGTCFGLMPGIKHSLDR